MPNTFRCDGVFIQRIQDLLPSVIWSVAAAIGIGEFCAVLAASSGLGGFFGALALLTTLKLMALHKNWDSIDGLVRVYIGSLISTVFGLMRTSILGLTVTVLELILGIKGLAEIGFGKLYSLINIPVSIAYQCVVMTRR